MNTYNVACVIQVLERINFDHEHFIECYFPLASVCDTAWIT